MSHAERLYMSYVIRSYRIWHKFKPWEPSSLIRCYYYLQVARTILFMINTSRVIVNILTTMMQPGNMLPLLLLCALIASATTVIKLNFGG